jgi:sporulation protein YlmC with PRC-barrel domain
MRTWHVFCREFYRRRTWHTVDKEVTPMRAHLGLHVRTSDGQDVGKIDRLIVDPSSGDVKEVVVRRGLILHQDVEVPIDAIRGRTEDDVQLSLTADEAKALPRFVESSYIPPPMDYVSPFGYPAAGLLWPAGYQRPLATPETADGSEREAGQARTAVIEKGSDVLTRDGETVGKVQDVMFDPETGHPTSFVVRTTGLFSFEEVGLPAGAVSGVDDKVIYLHLNKSEFEERSRPGE